MNRASIILLALMLSGCGKPPAAHQTPSSRFTLASKSITLPEDRITLPAGAGTALITQNCTGCHSAEMLTTQPKLDAKTWATEIAKMRTVYHAPIDVADDERLVAGLMTLQSRHSPRP